MLNNTSQVSQSCRWSPQAANFDLTGGKRRRPHDTVFPLSAHLGIPVDTSVDRDDIHGIVAAAKAYRGNGNVLICWEHKAIEKIVEKLGVEGALRYPKNRFDVIWTVKAPYRQLHSWKSEQIERLDEQHEDPRQRNTYEE